MRRLADNNDINKHFVRYFAIFADPASRRRNKGTLRPVFAIQLAADVKRDGNIQLQRAARSYMQTMVGRKNAVAAQVR
jgi:hypothetical protein